MPYTSAAIVEARMGSEEFLRAFDRDGDGVADTARVDAALLSADTIINAMLAASHATPFASPAPQFIIDIATMLVPWEGVKFFAGNASSSAFGPFKGLHDTAMELLKSLARDDRARVPEGPGKPTASLALMPAPASAPWSDARSGTSRTAF